MWDYNTGNFVAHQSLSCHENYLLSKTHCLIYDPEQIHYSCGEKYKICIFTLVDD